MNRIEDSLSEKIIAGIDEVGRGPLAGPVVACCVIMPMDTINEEIKDSKKITSKKKRERIAEFIKENALAYAIAEVSEKVIDEINIKEATRLAMKTAYENMIANYKIVPDLVLIDAEEIYLKINQKALIHGDDNSYNIAAASILAKVYRDRLFDEFSLKYPGYSFETNVGYGTKAHIEGIIKYGLTDIHRKSFVKKWSK